jgi:hypothetical protein
MIGFLDPSFDKDDLMTMANKPVLKATDFAHDHQTKTFLNWSIYELSTAFEWCLFDLRNRFSVLKAIPATRFTTVARYLGEAGIKYRMARPPNEHARIAIKPAVVEEQFPGIPERVSNLMADALSDKITEMENQCQRCNARCLSRPQQYCTFFEQQPDENVYVSIPVKRV